MGEIDLLIAAYESQVSTPWRERLSGSERVWFLVYSPSNERRLRRRLEEFAIVTRDARRGWKHLDMTDWFAQWLVSQRHSEGFYKRPDGLSEKRFVESIAATAVSREHRLWVERRSAV